MDDLQKRRDNSVAPAPFLSLTLLNKFLDLLDSTELNKEMERLAEISLIVSGNTQGEHPVEARTLDGKYKE